MGAGASSKRDAQETRRSLWSDVGGRVGTRVPLCEQEERIPGDQPFGFLTPYLERLRLRVALLVELGPDAPDASSVPRTTW
jgi:hypothetical protein